MKQPSEETQAMFESWLARNTQAWGIIEAQAISDAKAGRAFSIRPTIERLRWVDVVDNDGGRVGIASAIVPCMVRKLEAEHPEMKGLITRKPSKFDGEVQE